MSRVSRRHFLIGATAAPSAMAQFNRRKGKPKTWEPPNVVLVVAEELGGWACGCYGNKEILTPNIDMLARLGTRFRNSYVTTPVDSPSRATLHTGRLPSQHGIQDSLTGGTSTPTSFASEAMLSDLLSGAGYRCGYVGKWNMGDNAKPGHGFEFTYTLAGGEPGHQNPRVFRNGEEVSESGYLADLTTRAATGFLDQQSPDKRFFLTVNYVNPAAPYDGHPQKFYDQYAKVNFETIGYRSLAPNATRSQELLEDIVGSLRKYAAGVSALDAQIPALLNKLREKKLRRDTLVIFTSLTGNLLGRHGLWGAGLASDPTNMYEEAMKVPLIWLWPGEIPVEASRPELVSFYDVLPAVLHAAKVDSPASANLCGRSYLSIAMGGQWEGEEDWPTYLYGTSKETQMARDRRYKMVVRNEGGGGNELYDLTEDPGERRDRYDDPQYLLVKERLTEHLDTWNQTYRS